jgi:hypothetical protein
MDLRFFVTAHENEIWGLMDINLLKQSHFGCTNFYYIKPKNNLINMGWTISHSENVFFSESFMFHIYYSGEFASEKKEAARITRINQAGKNEKNFI